MGTGEPMTGCHGDSVLRRQRLDHIDDIDDWLDAVGDQLVHEFPYLIDENSEPRWEVGRLAGSGGTGRGRARTGSGRHEEPPVSRRVGSMALRGWMRDCEDRLFGCTWMNCMRQNERGIGCRATPSFHDGRES